MPRRTFRCKTCGEFGDIPQRISRRDVILVPGLLAVAIGAPLRLGNWGNPHADAGQLTAEPARTEQANRITQKIVDEIAVQLRVVRLERFESLVTLRSPNARARNL